MPLERTLGDTRAYWREHAARSNKAIGHRRHEDPTGRILLCSRILALTVNKPMYEQLDTIREKTKEGKYGKGFFDKIKNQISNIFD